MLILVELVRAIRMGAGYKVTAVEYCVNPTLMALFEAKQQVGDALGEASTHRSVRCRSLLRRESHRKRLSHFTALRRKTLTLF